jgi:hypothetical protein
MEDTMTDLKSRADELIDSAIRSAVEAVGGSPESAELVQRADACEAALTRFVHALCDASNMLGKSRTWAQHHSNCAMFHMLSKCDCGLSDFRPELESALAEVEKVGE